MEKEELRLYGVQRQSYSLASLLTMLEVCGIVTTAYEFVRVALDTVVLALRTQPSARIKSVAPPGCRPLGALVLALAIFLSTILLP